MYRKIRLLGLVSLCFWTAGCVGSSASDGSAPVKGTVMLDGKPMAEGEIVFELGGQGVAPSILQVKNGEFSGEAKIGKNRVEVLSYKPGPKLSTEPDGPPQMVNFIPERYNGQTTLEANVTESGPNEFKFEVTSK